MTDEEYVEVSKLRAKLAPDKIGMMTDEEAERFDFLAEQFGREGLLITMVDGIVIIKPDDSDDDD